MLFFDYHMTYVDAICIGKENEVDRSKMTIYQWLKAAAFLIPSIASVLIAFITVWMIKNDVNLETILVSDLVGAIGLSIGTWAALNIVNAIDRNEVNRLDELVDESGRQIEALRQEKTALIRQNIRDISHRILTSRGNSYYKRIAEKMDFNLYGVPGELAKALMKCDDDFVMRVHYAIASVCTLNEWNDIGIHEKKRLEVCRTTIGTLESLLSEAIEGEVRQMLDFLIAEVSFIEAYLLYRKEKEELFLQVGGRFIELFNNINDLDENHKKYFANAISQCYSEVIMMYIKDKKFDLVNDEWITFATKYGMIAVAGSSTQIAFDESITPESVNIKSESEIYLKNMGVVIERVTNRNPSRLDTSLKWYMKALECSEGNTHYSTYYVIMSALDRLIQKELESDMSSCEKYYKDFSVILERLHSAYPNKSYYYIWKARNELYKHSLGFNVDIDEMERCLSAYRLMQGEKEYDDLYHKTKSEMDNLVAFNRNE